MPPLTGRTKSTEHWGKWTNEEGVTECFVCYFIDSGSSSWHQCYRDEWLKCSLYHVGESGTIRKFCTLFSFWLFLWLPFKQLLMHNVFLSFANQLWSDHCEPSILHHLWKYSLWMKPTFKLYSGYSCNKHICTATPNLHSKFFLQYSLKHCYLIIV